MSPRFWLFLDIAAHVVGFMGFLAFLTGILWPLWFTPPPEAAYLATGGLAAVVAFLVLNRFITERVDRP